MDKWFNRLRRTVLIRALVFLILGIVAMIWPRLVFNALVGGIVGYLVIYGGFKLWEGRHLPAQPTMTGGPTVAGISALIGALLVWVFRKVIFGSLPFFIGIVLMGYGLNLLVQARRTQPFVNVVPWTRYLYGSVVLIAGLVLTFNPVGSLYVLIRILGAVLVMMSLGELSRRAVNRS